MPLRPGLAATVELTVTDADTAVALRSGSVPVLATPRIVALCEEAACQAIHSELEPGQTTVGMRIQLDHVAPSAVGTTVKAEATLERVEGRRLTYTLSVQDSRGLIAAGKLSRVLVDTDRFLEKAQ